jgi:plastocyanin
MKINMTGRGTRLVQAAMMAMVLVVATAIPSGAVVWSLRMAVNDLKFYPDQLFPVLTYPVDYDPISLPGALNEAQVQIPLGAEVTWINRDRNPGDEGTEVTVIPHLLYVKDGEGKVTAQSVLLTSLGQSFTARFDHAGEFAYGCMIHPMMRGKITGALEVEPGKLVGQRPAEPGCHCPDAPTIIFRSRLPNLIFRTLMPISDCDILISVCWRRPHENICRS